MDHVLRSELLQSCSCGTKRPLSSDVVVERLGGPRLESFMFDIQSGSYTCESSSRNFFGMSIVGQSVPKTSQYDGTDYATSELESIARKKADEPVGAIVCVGSAERFSLYSRTETHLGLGTGRTK